MAQAYSWYKRGKELKAEIEQARCGEEGFFCWYIGQMGMVFKWKETVIYVDPVLNDLTRPDGSSRRNYPIPFLPADAARADYIICTHAHADHLNLQTLVPMSEAFPGARLIVPAPEATLPDEAKIPAERVIPAVQEQILELESGIRICPIAAAHPEYAADQSGAQYALGYLLTLGDNRIYHSGDTYLTEELLARLQGEPIQLACLPINGRDFIRESRGIIGNMNSTEAGYLAGMIGADMTVPLHYDMVAGNEADPLDFLRYMAAHWPDRKCHIMKLGEQLLYWRQPSS